MSSQDTELVAAWRGGDARAGEQLIQRHFDAVERFFRTKAAGEADELVQQTFLRCAEGRDRFRGEGSFKAFLFGIARNVLLEHVRAKARERRMVDVDLGVTSIRDLAPGLSTAAWRHREQRRLIETLQTLPVELQMLLELAYWEELSEAELAAVLEIPRGTVKSRLFRARALLREGMALEGPVDARLRALAD